MPVASLKEASTGQLERLFEAAESDLELLQALASELALRPSRQAKALLAEVDLAYLRFHHCTSDDTIDWHQLIARAAQIQPGTDVGLHQPATCEDEANRVLNTWMTLETLSPQLFQNLDSLAHRGALLLLQEPMPWTTEISRPDQHRCFYQVLFGALDVHIAHEQLLSLYGQTPESMPVKGIMPLAVVTVDETGRLAGDYSVSLACFAWSYGRAITGRIDHLPYWYAAERVLQRRLRRRLSPVDDQQASLPLTLQDLEAAFEWLVTTLNLPVDQVQPLKFAIQITQPALQRPPRSPLLNSFLLADLWRAQGLLSQKKLNQVLQSYLGLRQGGHDTDLNPETPLDEQLKLHMVKRLVPEATPLACWPRPHHQGLDGLQQTAVNTILCESGPALFSVHGPPGTGKTTLIRDVIAGIIEKKALALSQFEHPADGFRRALNLRLGDQYLELFPLHTSLLGYEILVCSRNNRAAENISLELPLSKEVDQDCASLDYFKASMLAYLQRKLGPDHAARVKVWGLVAAALGNGSNRHSFIEGVWHDQQDGLEQVFEAMASQVEQGKTHALEQWSFARTEFLELRSRVQEALNQDPFWQLEPLQTDYQLPLSVATIALRGALFVAAMKLQKAFLLAAAPQMLANLRVFFKVLGGWRGSKPELLRHIWASGTLLVPVISTTFASVHQMLNDLESIGWVCIDEAGQGSPQDGVGALMRATKALVVGDPQQIEPVVSTPLSLVEAVGEFQHVSAFDWLAPDMSIQTLADRGNPHRLIDQRGRYGGWPILVHRRCAQPMFDMMNQIAYNGLMVRGQLTQGQSAWVHVSGISIDKWCPQEGVATLQLVQQLLQSGTTSIYVISPFVSCVKGLSKLFRTHEAQFPQLPMAAWVKHHVGTIHTFQGRQADHVILVLGAQNAQEAGARVWATARVNLCNVAVSRARLGFYVVGHYGLWSSLGAMKVIASHSTLV